MFAGTAGSGVPSEELTTVNSTEPLRGLIFPTPPFPINWYFPGSNVICPGSMLLFGLGVSSATRVILEIPSETTSPG